MYLLREGIQPVIFDKESFPRYHIGESLTGECGGRLRELGLESKLQAVGSPIKHGVRVYGAKGHNGFWVGVQKRDADHRLVPTTTWQVRRSTFDQMLLETALERGADYRQAQAVAPIVEGDRVCGLEIRTATGAVEQVYADVLLDGVM